MTRMNTNTLEITSPDPLPLRVGDGGQADDHGTGDLMCETCGRRELGLGWPTPRMCGVCAREQAEKRGSEEYFETYIRVRVGGPRGQVVARCGHQIAAAINAATDKLMRRGEVKQDNVCFETRTMRVFKESERDKAKEALMRDV